MQSILMHLYQSQSLLAALLLRILSEVDRECCLNGRYDISYVATARKWPTVLPTYTLSRLTPASGHEVQ